MFRNLLIIINVVCLYGCVSTPNQPANNTNLTPTGKGAYILCEGLRGNNNASLYRYSFSSSSSLTVQDYFTAANPNLHLGDVANDFINKGDTAFVAVTTSGTVEIFRISTGKWINRITLPGTNRAAREITIVNDTIGFITDFHTNSLTRFNPATFEIIADNIAVGYAPEGIIATDKYVFTANSGFGDYAYEHPEIKAHNISVIDIFSNTEIAVIPAGPDVQSLRIHPSKSKFYALYTHLPQFMKDDSLGGIVEYDAVTFSELRRWRMKIAKNFNLSLTGDTLLFLNNDGLYILPAEGNHQPKLVAKSAINEYWYGVNVCPYDGTVWICNAKGYVTNGELLILNPQNEWKQERKFPVGVNPNGVIFFDWNQ
ncbi:MAG: hypothetical protein HYZ54_03365 [Ignavibacteriae bacterium]|nr:hypothetical protein [Ignavibacteriota bacterium]